MADELSELFSPSAISRVSRDTPRQEQPPQRRRPPRKPAPVPVEEEAAAPADPDEPARIGSRLNVRA